MRIIKPAIIMALLALGGCSAFKRVRLGQSVENAKKRICLNAEGRGRFIFDGQKHVFSYQSHFFEDELKWRTVIDFPVYGRESIEIEWNKKRGRAEYDASYEQALLKNSEDLNPAFLEGATQMWVEFFEDMLVTKGLVNRDTGEKIDWSVSDKSLEGRLSARGYPGEISFLNPVAEGYFGRFDLKLRERQGGQTFGMELLVRSCLEKADN